MKMQQCLNLGTAGRCFGALCTMGSQQKSSPRPLPTSL